MSRISRRQKGANVNSQNATLGEFIQQLLIQIGPKTALHFKDERRWHELFYEMKTSPETPGKPRFLAKMFFDWNGEYPRSQELSSYLHSLHWTGCMAAANPGYDGFKLNSKVADLWRTEVAPDLANYIQNTAGQATPRLAA